MSKICRFLFLSIAIIAWTDSSLSAQDFRGNPQKGQKVYEQQCLRCHGARGGGNEPDADTLVVAPANFQAPATRDKSDFEYLIAISNGVLFSPMHSWRSNLTEVEMIDEITYIRHLAPVSPISSSSLGKRRHRHLLSDAEGGMTKRGHPIFNVQKHQASHQHYDFRLEDRRRAQVLGDSKSHPWIRR